MKAEELTVSILGDSTIEQQIDLYKICFEICEDYQNLYPFWVKKHYQNPLGKSLIFGVVVDGKLAGMNAFLPVKYTYKSEEVLCLQSCESGVNPLFQGRGIWKKIMLYATDYIFSKTNYKMIIGFPNYRNSYPGFVKMKWETKHEMNNYILINNTKSFIKTIGVPSFISVLRPFLSIQKMVCKSKILTSSVHYEIKESGLDTLIWQDATDTMNIQYSQDWLKWKIDYTGEQCINIYNNDSLVASCIYKRSTFEQVSVIRLDRICFKEENKREQKEILSNVICYLSKKFPDAAFFRIWTMDGQSIESVIKSLLFLKSSHPNPFIIKKGVDDYQYVNWNLSFFDLD